MKQSTLEEMLYSFQNFTLSGMYTAIPARVVVVYTGLNDQRIDAQPLPKRILEDGGTADIPPILNVPVMFPASSKAAFTFPIDVGDTVLLVFSQRGIDLFKSASNASTYGCLDTRKFSIRDAIAIPGLFPFQKAINNPAKRTWTHSTRDAVLVNNIGSGQENEFRLKESGDIEIKTKQNAYMTFADGLIECNNLTVNCSGDYTLTATNVSLTAQNVTYDVASQFDVTCPTTNWSGNFNLTGTITQAGGAGGGTATFNSPMSVNASVTITGGDVEADGISLKGHTHTGDSGGTTSTAN